MTWGLPVHGGLDLLPLLDYFGADLVSGKKKIKTAMFDEPTKQQALWYG
jgi:hypothetical protein